MQKITNTEYLKIISLEEVIFAEISVRVKAEGLQKN